LILKVKVFVTIIELTGAKSDIFLKSTDLESKSSNMHSTIISESQTASANVVDIRIAPFEIMINNELKIRF